jgi:hypothetical protein
LHALPQTPVAHVGAALAGAGQGLAQRPQFAGSVAKSTQRPPHRAGAAGPQSLAHA